MNIQLLYCLIGLETSLEKRGKSILPLLNHQMVESSMISYYTNLFLVAINYKKEKIENQQIIDFILSYSNNTKTKAIDNYLFMMYILNSLNYIDKENSYFLLKSDDYSSFSLLEIDEYYRLLQLDFINFSKEEIKNSSVLEQAFWILYKSSNYFGAILLAKDFSQDVIDLVYLLAPISYSKMLPDDVITELENHQQVIDAIFKYQLNYGV